MNAKTKKGMLETLSFVLKLLAGLTVVFPLIYGLCLSFMGMADIMANPPVLISEI